MRDYFTFTFHSNYFITSIVCINYSVSTQKSQTLNLECHHEKLIWLILYYWKNFILLAISNVIILLKVNHDTEIVIVFNKLWPLRKKKKNRARDGTSHTRDPRPQRTLLLAIISLLAVGLRETLYITWSGRILCLTRGRRKMCLCDTSFKSA